MCKVLSGDSRQKTKFVSQNTIIPTRHALSLQGPCGPFILVTTPYHLCLVLLKWSRTASLYPCPAVPFSLGKLGLRAMQLKTPLPCLRAAPSSYMVAEASRQGLSKPIPSTSTNGPHEKTRGASGRGRRLRPPAMRSALNDAKSYAPWLGIS